jgi:hypothetical protein
LSSSPTHHPSVQRRASDLHARFALDHHRLPVRPDVIAIILHNGVDYHRVLANPFATMRSGSGAAVTSIALASSFLAFGHPHEITRRLDIQLLAFVVADHGSFLTAGCECALDAANRVGDARQILRQWIAARIRLTLPIHPSASFFQIRPVQLSFQFPHSINDRALKHWQRSSVLREEMKLFQRFSTRVCGTSCVDWPASDRGHSPACAYASMRRFGGTRTGTMKSTAV